MKDKAEQTHIEWIPETDRYILRIPGHRDMSLLIKEVEEIGAEIDRILAEVSA